MKFPKMRAGVGQKSLAVSLLIGALNFAPLSPIVGKFQPLSAI
ncbi:hypothetical protein [Ancylothrix sp. D3o]|nr:hypothetical protein [Ancylothrix sp. D3o]